MKKSNVKYGKYVKFLFGAVLLCLSVSLSYADGGETIHGFGDWAKGIIVFFEQIKTFIQIVATVVGMWFVYSSLQLFRKHHTTQGAQGEYVRHGSGHLLLGVFLMCLVPGIQMLQSTFTKNLGDGKVDAFTVKDQSIFDQ